MMTVVVVVVVVVVGVNGTRPTVCRVAGDYSVAGWLAGCWRTPVWLETPHLPDLRLPSTTRASTHALTCAFSSFLSSSALGQTYR